MNAAKTVQVIDDEAAALTMVRLFLNAYGCSVLTAENGKTGLGLVREHPPGIVLTDLKMPGMDGFQVLKQIKKTAPGTEVVVITGHGDMVGISRVAPCIDTVESAISAMKKTSLGRRIHFVHGIKNKLAVSTPDQYTNDKHLRFPMNPTPPRKVENMQPPMISASSLGDHPADHCYRTTRFFSAGTVIRTHCLTPTENLRASVSTRRPYG